MLTYDEIKMLRQQAYYGSTLRIYKNIQHYSKVKTNEPKSMVFSDNYAIRMIAKFGVIVLEYVKIQEYIKFRQNIIEKSLRHEPKGMGYEIITALESGNYKWIDVGDANFREKMIAIKGDIAEIIGSLDFEDEVERVLKSNNRQYNRNEFVKIYNELMDEFEILCRAWHNCSEKRGVSTTVLRAKYQEAKNKEAAKMSNNLTKKSKKKGVYNG